MIFKAQILKIQSSQKNALEKALENQVMELMKEKPSVTQLEIAKHLELSRTKVQSVDGTNFILLKILCGYKNGYTRLVIA